MTEREAILRLAGMVASLANRVDAAESKNIQIECVQIIEALDPPIEDGQQVAT